MGKIEYEVIWKKGGWFEKGHFALVPKKSFSDKAGGALIGYLLLIAILLFIVSVILLTSPVWITLLGYQMVREKRYYAGLASLLALGYFYLDINKKWLTSLLFFGYENSDGKFVEGLFGLKYLQYLETVNIFAVGLGVGYIIDSILISKYGKKFNDDRITMPQLVVYCIAILPFLLISKFTVAERNVKVEQSISKETVDSGDGNYNLVENQDLKDNPILIQNDSINLAYANQHFKPITDLKRIPIYRGKPNTYCVQDTISKKFGIIDKDGKIVLPLEYDGVEIGIEDGELLYGPMDYFYVDYMIVSKAGKYGIIDNNYDVLVDFIYDEINKFRSDDIAYAKLNGKWGMIDKKGSIIVDFKYDNAMTYGGVGTARGYAVFKEGKNWGLIDLDGNIIIGFLYNNPDEINVEAKNRGISW